MSTVVVYVLFILTGRQVYSGGYGGPAVVDNISSIENCRALGRQIASTKEAEVTWSCHAVRKVHP